MTQRCLDSNFVLSSTKIRLSGSQEDNTSPLQINGEKVESSMMSWNSTYQKDLTWTVNICQLVKKAQQRFFPKKAELQTQQLVNFYRSIIESSQIWIQFMLTACKRELTTSLRTLYWSPSCQAKDSGLLRLVQTD